MPETEVEDAAGWRAHAEILFSANRLEEAAVSLQRAVESARKAADHEEEGRAEWLLARIYDVDALSEHRRYLARRHLERAEAAFARSGNVAALLDVLALSALRAAEAGDEQNTGYALAKAEAIDPAYASWWRSYTSHLTADADAAAAALRRCIDTIDVLGAKAEHMRRECLLKLALVTGDDPEGLLRDTPRDRLIGALRPAAIAGERSEEEFRKGVEAAERERRPIRSEVLGQRELSAAFDPLYVAAAAVADRHGRYREAIDLLALNTSRSFCARATMRMLWQLSPKQTFEVAQNANANLVQALSRFERRGGLGEQRGLELALQRRREAAYQVEEELVRLVPGPHRLFRPFGPRERRAPPGRKRRRCDLRAGHVCGGLCRPKRKRRAGRPPRHRARDRRRHV